MSQNNYGPDESPASSSPKRKSRSRHISNDPEQRVRVYDDQPPSSILKTYRHNRKPGQELPPGAQSPQPPGTRSSQYIAGLPVQDQRLSPPTARVSVIRRDTVLNRLFPNPSVRSKGGNSSYSGGTSVVLSSLGTHRTHLPINAAPAVLAQSVDAGRAVEVLPSTLAPSAPVTRNAHELHAMLSYLPIPPPSVQPMHCGLYQDETDLPPSPPPKSSPPSHRRESAHFQARLGQVDDLPGAPAAILIPATTSPTSAEDRSRQARSHQHVTLDPPTSLYPRSSRTYDTPLFVEDDPSSSSRSWSVPAATHILTPEPVPSRKLPKAKAIHGSLPRDSEPTSLLPPSDYRLYHLPDTRSSRSPPSEPLRHQRLL